MPECDAHPFQKKVVEAPAAQEEVPLPRRQSQQDGGRRRSLQMSLLQTGSALPPHLNRRQVLPGQGMHGAER